MITKKDGKFFTPQGLEAIELRYKDNDGKVKISYYVPVTEKMKHFRTADEFKNWSLETEMLEYDPTEVVFIAKVKDGNGKIQSTGHAHENQKVGYINKTSYIENAETSAVGRCLAYLNVGVIDDIAGYEEMQNAIKQQNSIDGVRAKLKTAIEYMTSTDIMSMSEIENIMVAEMFHTDIDKCDDTTNLKNITKKLRKKYEEWSK